VISIASVYVGFAMVINFLLHSIKSVSFNIDIDLRIIYIRRYRRILLRVDGRISILLNIPTNLYIILHDEKNMDNYYIHIYIYII